MPIEAVIGRAENSRREPTNFLGLRRGAVRIGVFSWKFVFALKCSVREVLFLDFGYRSLVGAWSEILLVELDGNVLR